MQSSVYSLLPFLKESKEMQFYVCKCYLYLQRDFLQGKPLTETITCRVKR